MWLFLLSLVFSCCVFVTSRAHSTQPIEVTALDALSRGMSTTLDRLTMKSMEWVAHSVNVPIGNNQTIHLLDFPGEGNKDSPPIVLLHGISSCAADYYPMIRLMQKFCSRVIALDLPGHGRSAADPDITLDKLESLMVNSLTTTLKHLGVGRFTLLGNSLGGFVACKYAARYSRNLHALVLISPAGAPMDPEKLQELQSLFNIKTLGEATSFLDSVFGQHNRLPFGLRQIVGWACRERTRRPVVRRILQEATVSNRLLESEAARIQCPILLIWGQKEEVFAVNQLNWFQKHLPTKLLSVIRPKDVGHIPHLDAEIVSESIETFLSGVLK